MDFIMKIVILMNRWCFRYSVILLFQCIVAFGKNAEIGYTVPLYFIEDRTAKTIAQIIDVELTKISMSRKLGALKKLPFAVDTAFRRCYQQDSVVRIDGGFLDPVSVCRHLHGPGLIPSKLLLVYDVTAHQFFHKWKGIVMSFIPEPSPTFTVGPSGNNIINTSPYNTSPYNIMENITAGSANDFDSLWCKVSYIDCANPAQSAHKAMVANDSTCDSKPFECVVEMIQQIGVKAATNSDVPDISLVKSPTDQHRGKIIGGSALITGGIYLLFLLNVSLTENKPLVYIGTGAMISGGATLLTIGIIRQAKYYAVH